MTCDVCGGPLRAHSKYGVCKRNPECEKERKRRYREEHAEALKERQRRFYEENAEALKERQRRYYEENAEAVKERRRRFYEEHVRYAALRGCKDRARKCGVPFTLTLEDIPEPPEVCPVLGIPLYRGTGRPGGNSPSLDRIFPELGYVPGNIRWISNRANTIKNNATADELLKVYQDLALLTLRRKAA